MQDAWMALSGLLLVVLSVRTYPQLLGMVVVLLDLDPVVSFP
jgi:hypothetical protein